MIGSETSNHCVIIKKKRRKLLVATGVREVFSKYVFWGMIMGI